VNRGSTPGGVPACQAIIPAGYRTCGLAEDVEQGPAERRDVLDIDATPPAADDGIGRAERTGR
jgi:hypothetical protein